MVFSSVIFLTYFLPLFLLIYFLIKKEFKNPFILISSILFYSWGAPKFIFVILATTTLDFYLVKLMDGSASKKMRNVLLVLSLSLNLGMLFYFKYCNFFVDNINVVLNAAGIKEIKWANVILPIGISFYTFESLTYVIDVYRKVHKPLNNFWTYQTYITLFPKLIAGPIVRYHEISDQLTNRENNETIDNKLSGFYRFCIGLGKKVIIANVMALKADELFNADISQVSTTQAWIGVLAYTFQIYFDFSGYSDMAIGICKMIGFKLPENFDNPYTSKSITEFWRRWHMTLGNWMKNYLYIPLGGNKVKTTSRLYFNLWLVFLASGFWHGAAWTFVFWGVFHGLMLVIERAFLLRIYSKIGTIIPLLITFFLINIGWILFRSNSLNDTIEVIGRLFTYHPDHTPYYTLNTDFHFYFHFALAVFFSFLTLFKSGQKIQNIIYNPTHNLAGNISLTALSVFLFVLSLAIITGSNFNPFIYFRF